MFSQQMTVLLCDLLHKYSALNMVTSYKENYSETL